MTLLTRGDKPAANKLKERLISALTSLETKPHRCPFFNEDYIPRHKHRKMYMETWYIVLYQLKDETVCGLDFGLQAGLRAFAEMKNYTSLIPLGLV